MYGRGLLLVAAGAAAALAAGCQTTGGTGELLVSSGPRVADVPIPVHFSRNDGSSFDHVSSHEIIVHHVYSAFRIPRYQVVAFYRKQMPVANWQPIGELDAGRRRVMAFERGGEKCLIHLRKRLFFWTVLKVEVVGRPSGSN